MNSTFEPFRRFPWLVILGLPIALIAALLVMYEVSWASGTPSLVARNKPTYQATAQVLVNSAANPYLSARESPASRALLDAANYLPFIIQSDKVAAIREKEFGPMPGEVFAQALFARETNRGLNASSIPIIEVTGLASTSKDSVQIAQRTIDAFLVWLATEQQQSTIGPAGRILVEPLRSPVVSVEQKSPTGLAVLAFIVVLLGFVALAWVLDRVSPASSAAGDTSLDEERTLEATVPSHNGSPVVGVAGVEKTMGVSTEEPEPESESPASQRRWA